MTIAVALSGGIDSLVAAHLLRQQNTDLIGIHFTTGYEAGRHGDKQKANGPEPTFSGRVRQIARQLDIPLHIVDCRRDFEKHIVADFARAYRSGRTPNPCVRCNRIIKFGAVMAAARRLGATHLATGHYARIIAANTGTQLHKGADRTKDQSYFLAMLTADQLSGAIFPLGELSKDRVKKIAEDNHLYPVSGRESQDICFIPGQNYADFLEEREAEAFGPGEIVDTEGYVIGRHKGLHRYTVGQRRGLHCPAEAPYYVVRIDIENNRLVVGFENSLYKETCRISGVNWLIRKPDDAIEVRTKIRYRHHAAPARLAPGPADTAVIRFQKPQKAITPGQAAVCYHGDMVAAAGWIE